MIIKSIKTSELYIVAFVLAVWGMDQLGIDVGQVLAVLLDLRTTAADVARELQGIEEPKGTAGYWLAAAWLAARTVLKAKGPEQPVSTRINTDQPLRRDPYRSWQSDLGERPANGPPPADD
ncbi:MAG: hypothetical protein KQH59_18080 [Desulfobulbaceae bacterium]|nr:hypothetical protein [Desulfobulbaceae bacterium]